ncbi:formate transporter [Marmoricola endophyticus]|uniref:Formate transporter n=1 Tax=Marmoricola endophyticus TaxID=2040280 RepID=A0A917BM03_9ACTN|nr:formate/nitrite transporter family protein [Marmoricola endophyticus]GGF46219.1 formate transporter [Marmoricola endophyticus]
MASDEPEQEPRQELRPEPQVEHDFDRLVEEGQERLHRPFLALVATGLLGGVDIGTGLLAYLVVRDTTGSVVLSGIAFSIAFVALLLARSELFTENFLVPVTAVVAKHGSPVALLRLWAVTLVTNLVGGALMAWVVVHARPDLQATARETGTHYADLGVSLESLLLAVLAGAVITLMTRMQHATESLGVQLVPAVLLGSLLAGAELFHCVLDSLFIFAAMFSGADIGVGEWPVALAWSALGNAIGGIGLVTAIRLLRVPKRVEEARADPA